LLLQRHARDGIFTLQCSKRLNIYMLGSGHRMGHSMQSGYSGCVNRLLSGVVAVRCNGHNNDVGAGVQ